MKKRYNLTLPKGLYDEIKNIADSEKTTALEVMKKLIKTGFLLYNIQTESDDKLIIRLSDGSEKEFRIIF